MICSDETVIESNIHLRGKKFGFWNTVAVSVCVCVRSFLFGAQQMSIFFFIISRNQITYGAASNDNPSVSCIKEL